MADERKNVARVKEELRKTKAKEEKERKEKQERDLAARKLTAEVARGRTKEAGLKAEAEAAGRRLKALRDDVLKITDAAVAAAAAAGGGAAKELR